ncbi:MAG: hypothetical protein KBE65_05465 [Phycisphaerae bacterium]|nr:hypothetical protein [Phycisphaerae bacterium]
MLAENEWWLRRLLAGATLDTAALSIPQRPKSPGESNYFTRVPISSISTICMLLALAGVRTFGNMT